MNDYLNYIDEVLVELIERCNEGSDELVDIGFKEGYNQAYKEVITFLINQAEIFDIKKSLNETIKNFTPPL